METVGNYLSLIATILEAFKSSAEIRTKRQNRREIKLAHKFYKKAKKLMLEDKIIDEEEKVLLKQYRNKIYKASIALL